MKDKLSFFILGSLCGGLLACAAFTYCLNSNKTNPQARVLKLAHGLDSSHPVHAAIKFMGNRVEELSKGKLKIDIYSGGSLGSESQCMEQIKNGSLDMGKTSSSPMSIFVPQLEALCLPYLYRDSGHYWRVLESPVGERILAKLKDNGFVGLCYYDAGARSFYTTKRKVRSPKDLENLKIRVLNARSEIVLMRTFGASPAIISPGETYTALSQGIVDGAENNPPTYLSSAHFECAKYFSQDEHTRFPDILYIGKSTWNKLSEDEQRILIQAAKESSTYQRKLWKTKTDEAVKELKKRGVEFIEVDKSEFKTKAMSVYDTLKGTEIGKLAEEIMSVK